MRRSLASICDVDFVGFGQHGDRRRRRVNAAARFGRRHALHAVHAALVLQLAVDALAFDVDDDFLDAALAGFAERHHLELPALALGVARVHAIEVAGEERRLVAARAAADFDDDVLLVVGILGQQQHLELAVELLAARRRGRAAPPRRARASRRRCRSPAPRPARSRSATVLYSRYFSTSGSMSDERLRLLAVLGRIVLHGRRAERGHQFLVPRLERRQACRTCRILRDHRGSASILPIRDRRTSTADPHGLRESACSEPRTLSRRRPAAGTRPRRRR